MSSSNEWFRFTLEIRMNSSIETEFESTPGLRSGHPNATSAKRNPPRPDAPRVLYRVWQQPLCSGGGTEELVSLDGSLEGDGLESPLWPLTSRLEEWTVPPSLSQHPLTGLFLVVWPFKWPLDTVHVSHVLAVACDLWDRRVDSTVFMWDQ